MGERCLKLVMLPVADEPSAPPPAAEPSHAPNSHGEDGKRVIAFSLTTPANHGWPNCLRARKVDLARVTPSRAGAARAAATKSAGPRTGGRTRCKDRETVSLRHQGPSLFLALLNPLLVEVL